jgi:hypothetical protein
MADNAHRATITITGDVLEKYLDRVPLLIAESGDNGAE